jgi:hypothetical protein
MNFGVATVEGVVAADRGDLARRVPVRDIGMINNWNGLKIAVKSDFECSLLVQVGVQQLPFRGSRPGHIQK